MKWRCRVFFASLLAILVPVTHAAPPRVWFEARVEPSTVPVNAQATYVQRFGYAVDVRAPRLDAPVARLAEILPLGPVREFEQTREGLRYRVHEQRFAILPFASGALRLETAAHGTTPAVLAETGGRASFTLQAQAVTLNVTPATAGANWLPATAVQLSATGNAPAALKVGEVWTRQLLIEAVGVDGSVIGAPRWGESADWTLQFDPPTVGRRIEDGRVIGYRRQTVHAQPRRTGRLDFPPVVIDWWQLPPGGWTTQHLAPVAVDVVPGQGAPLAPAEPSSGAMAVATPPPQVGPFAVLAPVFGLALMLVIGLSWLARTGTVRRLWRRHLRWREFDAACRANNPVAARQALQVWAKEWCGALPLGELPALSPAPEQLRAALAALDVACYGPPAVAGRSWQGAPLRRALRDLSCARVRRRWRRRAARL